MVSRRAGRCTAARTAPARKGTRSSPIAVRHEAALPGCGRLEPLHDERYAFGESDSRCAEDFMIDGQQPCPPVGPCALPANVHVQGGASSMAFDRSELDPFRVDVVPNRDEVRVCPIGELDLATVPLV